MRSLKLLFALVLVSAAAHAQTSTKGVNYITQAANPCTAGTSCMWVDTTNKQINFTDGVTAFKVTEAGVYAMGVSAADETALITAAKGPLICKANAAATGALLQTQTSGGAVLASFTDNSTNSLTSAMADGASAIALKVDTTTAWSNATALIARLLTNGAEKFAFYALGAQVNTYNSISTAQTAGLTLQNTTAATNGAQQYSPTLSLRGQRNDGAVTRTVGHDIQSVSVGNGTDPGFLRFYGTNTAGTQVAGLEFAIGSGVAPRIQNPLETADSITLSGNMFLGAANGNILVSAHEKFGLAPTFDPGGIASWWYATELGGQLTAAATITPSVGIHHVTGATTIDTITATNSYTNTSQIPEFTIIADGGTITWSAAGNVAVAGTVAQNKAQKFYYDANTTKWYPQQ